MTPAEPYPVHDVPLHFVKELSAFGIVYLPPNLQSVFFPTPLANCLLDGTEANNIDSGDGFIFVETTFRIFSYSTAPLHFNLLSRFSQLACKLPNLSVWKLTKETAMNAFRNGLSFQNVQHFLKVNAHIRMKLDGGVPLNVLDQIEMWYKELRRYTSASCVLLSDFESVFAFEECARVLKSHVIYSNQKELLIGVTPEGHRIYSAYNQSKIDSFR